MSEAESDQKTQEEIEMKNESEVSDDDQDDTLMFCEDVFDFDEEPMKKKPNLCDNNFDVTFLVGPQKTPIHAVKIMLQHISPVFRSMFNKDWSKNESGVEKTQIISIPDADPDIFEKFLKILPIKIIDQYYLNGLKLTEQEARDLIKLARKYEVLNVEKACKDFLPSGSSSSSSSSWNSNNQASSSSNWNSNNNNNFFTPPQEQKSPDDPTAIVLKYEFMETDAQPDDVKKAYEAVKTNFEMILLIDEALAVLSSTTLLELLSDKLGTFKRAYPLDLVNELEILKRLVKWGMLKCESSGLDIIPQHIMEFIEELLPHIIFQEILEFEVDNPQYPLNLVENELKAARWKQFEEIKQREQKELMERNQREEEIKLEELAKKCEDYVKNFQDMKKNDDEKEADKTDEQESEFVFGVTGTKIRGNKNFMEILLPFFTRQFDKISLVEEPESENGRKVENKQNIVKLPKIEHQTFENFQKIVQEKNLTRATFTELNLTVDDVLNIMILSKIYYMDNIAEVCGDYFLNYINDDLNFDPVNFVRVYEGLRNIGGHVETKARDVLKENFIRVLSNDEAFEQFSSQTWNTLLEDSKIGESRSWYLKGLKEVDILRKLLSWGELKFQKENKEVTKESMLNLLRSILPFIILSQISSEELQSFVNSPLIDEKYLRQLKITQLHIEKNKSFQKGTSWLNRDHERKEKEPLEILATRCDDYYQVFKNEQDEQEEGSADETDSIFLVVLKGMRRRIRGKTSVVQKFLPYFEKHFECLLTSSVVEEEGAPENQTDIEVIRLPEVDPKMYETFLKVVHKEGLQPNFFSDLKLSAVDIFHLLTLSKIFYVNHVEKACREYFVEIATRNDPVAVVCMYELFRNSDEPFIMHKSFNGIQNNFGKILVHAQALEKLSEETLTKILSTTKCGSGTTSSVFTVDEVDILRGVFRWGEVQCRKKNMEINQQNMRSLIGGILSHILYRRMSNEELENFQDDLNVIGEDLKVIRDRQRQEEEEFWE